VLVGCKNQGKTGAGSKFIRRRGAGTVQLRPEAVKEEKSKAEKGQEASSPIEKVKLLRWGFKSRC
jgi:hypothetical protein